MKKSEESKRNNDRKIYACVSLIVSGAAMLIYYFYNLNELIKNMNSSIISMNSSLSDEIHSMKDEMKSFSRKLDTMSGSFGIAESKKYTGRIKIYPPSDRNNSYASGCVINMNDEIYFLINKHVLIHIDDNDVNKKPPCLRTIESIQLYDDDDETLEFDEKNILIHKELDLAIIPLKNMTKGAEVSKKQVKLMDYIVGLSYRELGVVGLHGRILERSEKGVVLGDIGGTHGFSGTGYFSGKKLVAVHTGQGDFKHFQNLGYLEQQLKFNKTLEHVHIIEFLIELIEIHSRNPRTKMVEAKYVFEIRNRLKNLKYPKCE